MTLAPPPREKEKKKKSSEKLYWLNLLTMLVIFLYPALCFCMDFS